MSENLSEIEEKSFYEDDSAQVPPSDIIAYNELRSCADLFRMHKQGILQIQPDFQRGIVIDGLQRIHTIVRFLEGGDWKLSPLEDIEPEVAGKSVAAIKLENNPLHQYYTRVENLTVPVTVLRCDFSKKNHMEYLF